MMQYSIIFPLGVRDPYLLLTLPALNYVKWRFLRHLKQEVWGGERSKKIQIMASGWDLGVYGINGKETGVNLRYGMDLDVAV